MSNVRMEETAMSSDDEEDVTAMKRVRRSAMAPGFPRRATAAKGAESPEDTCDEVMLFGKVGYAELEVRATAASPKVVANPKGMANQAIPPMI